MGWGGKNQALVGADGHRRAVLGRAAALPQWPAGARLDEAHRPFGAHRPGMPAGAGDGAGVLIDAEIVTGEPALDGRAQRLGLDHGVVPTGTVGGAGLSGAVGGVAIHLQALAVFLVGRGLVVTGTLVWHRLGVGLVVAVAGDHLLAAQRVAAGLPDGFGQLAVGEQSGVLLGGHGAGV